MKGRRGISGKAKSYPSFFISRLGYSPWSVLFKDGKTGSKLFVGGQKAASDEKFIKENNIKTIVNCTARGGMDFGEIEYLRVPIATWDVSLRFKFNDLTQSEEFRSVELLRFVDSFLDVVDASLERGCSVLIHCVAGAHRAGTVAVLFIMRRCKVSSSEAIILAQKLRGVINPVDNLKELLTRVDRAVSLLNDQAKLDSSSPWTRRNINTT